MHEKYARDDTALKANRQPTTNRLVTGKHMRHGLEEHPYGLRGGRTGQARHVTARLALPRRNKRHQNVNERNQQTARPEKQPLNAAPKPAGNRLVAGKHRHGLEDRPHRTRKTSPQQEGKDCYFLPLFGNLSPILYEPTSFCLSQTDVLNG
jgi:hypothetical protein